MAGDRTNVNVRIALTASVVLHLIVCLLALPALLKAAAAMTTADHLAAIDHPGDGSPSESQPDGDETQMLEIEIQMPEFVEMIVEPEVRSSVLQYLRTTQNAPEEAPEQASFQSDRNTRAATETDPASDSTAELPSQEGVDISRHRVGASGVRRR